LDNLLGRSAAIWERRGTPTVWESPALITRKTAGMPGMSAMSGMQFSSFPSSSSKLLKEVRLPSWS